MAIIRASEYWTPLDNVLGRNRAAPLATHVLAWARVLDHIGAHHRRCLFSQHFAVNTASSLAPIIRHRYNDDRQNGRRLFTCGLHLPPFAVAPVVPTPFPNTSSDAGTYTTVEVEATITEPEDTRTHQATAEVTPSGAYINRLINTANAFRMVAASVFDGPVVPMHLDTAWGEAVEQFLAQATRPITHQFLTDLRALEDALWLRHRPVLAMWSARGEDPAQARTVTGATFTNLIDGSVTGYASLAGEICPVQYAGRGAGTTVEVAVACYAEVTAGTGTVRFTSSLGSVDAAVVPGAAWVQPAGLLSLDTTIEYDRVNISAAAGAAPDTVRVWRWMIQVDPA